MDWFQKLSVISTDTNMACYFCRNRAKVAVHQFYTCVLADGLCKLRAVFLKLRDLQSMNDLILQDSHLKLLTANLSSCPTRQYGRFEMRLGCLFQHFSSTPITALAIFRVTVLDWSCKLTSEECASQIHTKIVNVNNLLKQIIILIYWGI